MAGHQVANCCLHFPHWTRFNSQIQHKKVHHSTGDLNMIGHVLTIQIPNQSVTGSLLTLEKKIGGLDMVVALNKLWN